MATVVDTLVTRFKLQDDFSTAAQGILSLTKDVIGRLAQFGALSATGLVAFVAASSKAAAEMESLRMGLTAVAGGAAAADQQLKRLKEIAKLPGLGFEEAIQGSINLQAAGFSAIQAEGALMAFGNALATVGRGKDDLAGVIVALTQIVSTGKVTADNINQIANRVPQIRKAMQAAFGTASTEDLQNMGLSPESFVAGVVGELRKLPSVAGGTANAFENIGDAVKNAMVSIGNVVNKYLVPPLNRVSDILAYLNDRGVIGRIAQGFASLFTGASISMDDFSYSLFYIVRYLEDLPRRIRDFSDSITEKFNAIKEVAIDLASMFVMLGTARVINAIMAFARGIRLLISEVRTLGITAAIAKAMGGDLKQLYVMGAAVIAGIGANLAMRHFLDGDQKEVTGGAPLSMDDVIAARAKGDLNRMKSGGGNSLSDMLASIANTALANQNSYAARTANATESLVDMEHDRLQMERRVIGGGTVGSNALDPVHVGRMTRDSRGVGGPAKRKLMQAIDDYFADVLNSRLLPGSQGIWSLERR